MIRSIFFRTIFHLYTISVLTYNGTSKFMHVFKQMQKDPKPLHKGVNIVYVSKI